MRAIHIPQGFVVSRRAGVLMLALLLIQGAQAREVIYRSHSSDGIPVYTNAAPTEEPARLVFVFESPPPRPASSRAEIPARPVTASRLALLELAPGADVEVLIRRAAQTYRVEPALLRALIRVESGFNPAAQSSAGAVGLMQLMPATARRYGVTRLRDPAHNVDAGTRYLKDLLDLFGGDRELALAAYNAGEGAVIRSGYRIPPYPETRSYVPTVLAHYHAYRRQAQRAETEPGRRVD